VKIAVVGSGITGLSAAKILENRGHEVFVYEATSRLGGRLFTEDFAGDPLEWGPNTLLSSHESFDELITLAGVSEKQRVADSRARFRYVWKNGKAIPLPTGPLKALFSPLLGVGACVRALCEPFVPQGDPYQDVSSFFSHRFGKTIADNLVDPFVSGIYSGDSQLLSARHAFPKIVGMVDDHGSVLRAGIKLLKNKKKKKKTQLVNFDGGMSTLVDGLASRLKNSPQFHKKLVSYDQTDQSITLTFEEGEKSTFDKVVLALTAGKLSRIVKKESRSLSSALQQIPCPGIAVVHVRGAKLTTPVPTNGFGVLFGRQHPMEEALGILFISDIFPRKDRQKHFCVFLGGRRFPNVNHMSKSQIEDKAINILRNSIKMQGDAEDVRSQLLSPGLPQYEKNMYTIDMLKSRFHKNNRNIALVGTWSGGISVLDGFKNVNETLKDW